MTSRPKLRYKPQEMRRNLSPENWLNSSQKYLKHQICVRERKFGLIKSTANILVLDFQFSFWWTVSKIVHCLIDVFENKKSCFIYQNMHVDVEFWEDPISQKYTSVQFHGAYNIKGNMDIRIMSVPEKETSKLERISKS